MATKATTKKSSQRPTERSRAGKPHGSEPLPKPQKQEAKEPTTPMETVSLIEPKEKRPPRPARTARAHSVLPPISKLKAAAAKPKPAPQEQEEQPSPQKPAAEPAEQPEAAAPSTVTDVESYDEGEVENDKVIHIKPPIIVKDLATHLDLKPFQVISELMEMNIFAAINHTVEPDIAAKICANHGFTFEKEKRKKDRGVHKKVEVVKQPPPPKVEEIKDELKTRPPIVTFMGHVDHGKTTLMDYIRKARVAAGEAGGITQHIGAYSVNVNNQKITFLDTPGHQAFTAMRARGANVTDIVVLVVAADDGLMPQTIEAINHAKAAKVSIVVAINKCDLPSANPDKVKNQLQEQGLAPEDWGGETICCEISALKGAGVDRLLEMILLQSEILELEASPGADARGTVIEAQVEPGRGPTASVIVEMGTLKVGNAFICGNYWGKVKSMLDHSNMQLKGAGPATPVKVLGFSGLPDAGDELVVMKNEKSAKTLSEERLGKLRREKLATPQRATLENLFEAFDKEEKKTLRVVVKTDVQGSLEAVCSSLAEIKSEKIDLEIVHSGVGPITESDVLLATASDCIIIGFNVKVENSASSAAKRENVQIKLFSIIYELIDQIKEAMTGMLDPELRETVIGHAEVKQVFELSRGTVAGCIVTDGRINRSARARVLRKGQPVYDGGIATLRRFQDDVKEVRAGVECGVKLGDYTEYQEGDVIEIYSLEKFAQEL